MLCINVSVYQCFVLMLVLWEETFVYTCKRTHPAMMPSTSFFPCHPCPALTSPGRLWVPPHYPVASGHSQALLKPAGIQSQLWQPPSLHSWMTGSVLRFLPRVRWKERTGERNAPTKVGFYVFISLKIYILTAAFTMQTEELYDYHERMYRAALVFFFCPPPFLFLFCSDFMSDT